MTLEDLKQFSYEERMKWLKHKFLPNKSIFSDEEYLGRIGDHLSSYPDTVKEFKDFLKL